MSQLSFSDLNIDPAILKAVEEMGYTTPTEIQEKAIPALLKSKGDFVGQAQTGTGKTAAFVIPLLSKLDPKEKHVQAVILAPTRELAVQVENEIKKLGQYTDFRSTCIYGGTGYDKQIQTLKGKNPHIVVGTPGRMIDLIKKGVLKLSKASFCVLDEADEMLNMGFFEDVQMIVELFKQERQLVMFSATMPGPIAKLIKKTFRDYEMVSIEKKSLSNDDIEQKYFVVKDKYHKESLARLIASADDVYGIVFCRTRRETNEVGEDLRKRGYFVEILNGDMGQNERDRAMKNFKEKKVKLMVCTDVAARGIDVDNLTHVFNFGLPQDNESYVHRIGRTGRAGQKGIAYTIVGPAMAFAIKKIERHIRKDIELGKLPTATQLKRRMMEKELTGVQGIVDAIKENGDQFKVDSNFDLFLHQVGDLSQEELLKLMFTWKFNKPLRTFNELPDIEVDANANTGRNRARSGRGRSGGGGDPKKFAMQRKRSKGGRGGGKGKPNRGGSGGRSQRPSR